MTGGSAVLLRELLELATFVALCLVISSAVKFVRRATSRTVKAERGRED